MKIATCRFMTMLSGLKDMIISRMSKSYLALSARDRTLLLALAVFLLGAGYYQFIFEPVYRKWNSSQAALSEKKKELRKMELKIKDMRLMERDMKELTVKMSLISARMNMPSADKDLPVVVRSITQAARRASVKVANIRPVAVAQQEGKDMKPTTFSVEGSASANEVVTFLEKLWGARIEELSLSRSEDRENPVHFFTKITLIPSLEFPVSAVKVAPFIVAEDLFRPREYHAPLVRGQAVKTAMPPPSADPVPAYSEPSLDLSGLRLVGITAFPGTKFAAVADGATEVIVALGEKLRSYTVSDIDEKGLELAGEAGLKGRLDFTGQKDEFPEGTPEQSPAQAAMRAPVVQQQKKGRLGLKLQNLTPELASQKKLQADSGLLVLGARAGEQQVFVDDIITSINNIGTPTMNEAVRVMQLIAAGDEVELSIMRGSVAKKVKIKAME